jgi:hypothetical protein
MRFRPPVATLVGRERAGRLRLSAATMIVFVQRNAPDVGTCLNTILRSRRSGSICQHFVTPPTRRRSGDHSMLAVSPAHGIRGNPSSLPPWERSCMSASTPGTSRPGAWSAPARSARPAAAGPERQSSLGASAVQVAAVHDVTTDSGAAAGHRDDTVSALVEWQIVARN